MRDKLLRPLYGLSELRKIVLKSLLSSSKYNIDERLYYSKLFFSFTKHNCICMYRNCCLFSNSSHVVFRQFKLSRHFSKQFASMVIY